MTTNQRITLMADWWPAACVAQGWSPNDRAQRLAVLSEAVGRPLKSASELDSVEDVSRVKRHLGKLSGNVAHVREEVAPGIERGRRLRFVIEGKMKALAGHLGREGAAAYLAEIIADKFQEGSHGAHSRALRIADLSGERPPGEGFNKWTGKTYKYPSQLDQVLMKLNAKLSALAKVPKEEGQPF